MKPIRLILENFYGHKRSEIDFEQFSSSLIIGRVDGNEQLSNGVGKTTIFKSIEYVLFNESDEALEKVIRDDTNMCKVIFYFITDNQLYRISRSRTRKGASDLSFHKRTTIDGTDEHIYIDNIDKDNIFWKDISSRRTGDTEKDLEKLIKITFKGFRNTHHFVQHDFAGMATLTAEKRKALLKEVLQIGIYSKLEKLAKDKVNEINQEIIKFNTILETLKNPEDDNLNINKDIISIKKVIKEKESEKETIQLKIDNIKSEISNISTTLFSFEDKTKDLKNIESNINIELKRINSSINDFQSKKSSTIESGKKITEELNINKNNKNKLLELDYEKILQLESLIEKLKTNNIKNNMAISTLINELEDLKIPFPSDASCKYCRQTLSPEHKITCKNEIDNKIFEKENLIKEYKLNINNVNIELGKLNIELSSLVSYKKELESIENKINLLDQDLKSKRDKYVEYNKLLEEQKNLYKIKQEENEKNTIELNKLNTNEINLLKKELDNKKEEDRLITNHINSTNKELVYGQNSLAVLEHKLSECKENIIKKEKTLEEIKLLDEKMKVYPSVIQAFSSSGIPHLIIQSVLDDWQIEANNLLGQLRPGLQLSFYVEKEDSNGEQKDTLDIKYYLNNKDREYGQLSGAQKVSIAFALKLGLSFLLQKMFGASIELLLFDEIDQSLDKAGVDAFAEIVKYFQKDFKILVITHNDRLKDKFSSAIVVEQDLNAISTTKIMQW